MDLNVRRITEDKKAKEIRKQLARSKQDTGFIEDMEKKVLGIQNKQVELEEGVRDQRKKLEKRLGEIPKREVRRESISLKHVDTLRDEFQTQVFCDWKAMMK